MKNRPRVWRRRRRAGCGLALAACLCLTGCAGVPAAREMGNMALLRAMGVDTDGEAVLVTASTGLRASGTQGEEAEALTLRAGGPSLSAACLSMQGQSDSYVFFGYVDQLLLGEELARQGVRPVLDYFARDVELGLGARLWLVRGTRAGQAVDSGGEEGVDSRLSTLQTDGELGAVPQSRTAGEVYTDLLERGSAFVPALALAGEEGRLTATGYGVLSGERLVGFLEGGEAQGLELLAGCLSADILEEELPGGNRTAVRLISARTRSTLAFQGERPAALRLTCQVTGRLEEYQSLLTGGERAQLAARLEQRLTRRLEQALARLQDWGTDCAGLGPRAALACPGKWQRIQGDWSRWFAQLAAEVQVTVKLYD